MEIIINDCLTKILLFKCDVMMNVISKKVYKMLK